MSDLRFFFLVGNWDDEKNPETHFEVSGLFSEVPCGDCPYFSYEHCEGNLRHDILALLKEQQKLIDDITRQRMDNGAFD